jgi:hypothetical protein
MFERIVAPRHGKSGRFGARAERLAHGVGIPTAAIAQGEEIAVARPHADEAASAKSLIPVPSLRVLRQPLRIEWPAAARGAEEGFEKAARSAEGRMLRVAGLIDGPLKLAATGIHMAEIPVLGHQIRVVRMHLPQPLGNRAAFRRGRPAEDAAEHAALAAPDGLKIVVQARDLDALALGGGRYVTPAAPLQSGQLGAITIAGFHLRQRRLACREKGSESK